MTYQLCNRMSKNRQNCVEIKYFIIAICQRHLLCNYIMHGNFAMGAGSYQVYFFTESESIYGIFSIYSKAGGNHS